jgi:uncharacterized protein (UPF0335 family)
MSEPSIGHNGQLKSIVERIENLDVTINELRSDRNDILAEAKSAGFCPKTLRKVVSIRKEDAKKREHAQAILDSYLSSLGMI